ncbi:hypothetical protein EDD18DRAFT_1173503 [Armillaria luteobubalina]|uniref:Uncharacterized protein n=1 Tax=Armillaria luteobubalina TaxID=153913 RepID=A0AA39UN35_9AGAR|nr:hypothetical protein EDD18DRAFT_1173503 [Armillaria luteobubalina]
MLELPGPHIGTGIPMFNPLDRIADAQPAPWPQFLTKSFLSAIRDSNTDESAFYEPYTRLLYHVFSIDGPFEIISQFHVPATPRDNTDFFAIFTVKLDKHPVLFIEVKPPASFRLDSKRQQADRQVRECFRDLRDDVVTAVLPGVSAFGTRLSFYRYVKAANAVTPSAIVADLNIMTDAAPNNRWDCDILDADGAARFREVIDQLIACKSSILFPLHFFADLDRNQPRKTEVWKYYL